MGWGNHGASAALAGFDATYPLFVLDDAGEHYATSEIRRKFFAPEIFPAHKEDRTIRTFCPGGSMVQGRPYSKETSVTTWLRINLEAVAI